MDYYIASCVFTAQFPELSAKIQDLVSMRYGLEVVRCCVPRYKLREFEGRMPEGKLRDRWAALPDSGDFHPGDRVFSLCHNCNNIIEETRPGVKVHSLWELLAQDGRLPLPSHAGLKVTIQDCWRARDRHEEQDAVRALLTRMGIDWAEAPESHESTEFCGCSLLRAQPPRNPKLAPRHYVDGAKGKFVPHTEDEQRRLMEDHCAQLPAQTVICYCHYCLEGLLLGGADARHIAHLVFSPESEGMGGT